MSSRKLLFIYGLLALVIIVLTSGNAMAEGPGAGTEKPVEFVNLDDVGYACYSDGHAVVETAGHNTSITVSGKVIGSIGTEYTVTEVGCNVFSHGDPYSIVKLPGTIVKIGDNAFSGCGSIGNDPGILSNVQYIGKGAFMNCTNMPAKIDLSNCTYVGDYAFYNCGNITSNAIILGDAEYIGKEAFYNCSELNAKIDLSNCTYVGDYAFCYCSKITGDANMLGFAEYIGTQAFSSCSNLGAKINLTSCQTIGDYAFSGCKQITAAIPGNFLSNNLKSLGEWAFKGCKKLDVTIISGMMGPGLFGTELPNIARGAFSGCGDIHIISEDPRLITIGDSAFSYCKSLNINAFSLAALSKVGDFAFSHTPLTLEESDPMAMDFTVGEGTFENCGFTFFTLPKCTKIWKSTFAGCDLSQVEMIPDEVTEIEAGAFEGMDLSRLWCIPVSLTVIEHDTFRNCTLGENFCLSDKIESVGDRAFENCTFEGLGMVLNIGSMLKKVGTSAFSGCNVNQLKLPDTVQIIGESAFGCSFSGDVEVCCSELDGNWFKGAHMSFGCVKLGDTVKRLGDNALSWVGDSPVTVELNNTLESIGSYALSGCSFENLNLPETVTVLSDHALSGCKIGVTLTVPSRINSMGVGCFTDILSMGGNLNVQFKASVDEIDASMFNGSEISSMEICGEVKKIGNEAFLDSGLQSITFPSCLTEIGEKAFYGCFKDTCTSLELPVSLTTVGMSAFEGCICADISLGSAHLESIGDRAFATSGLGGVLKLPSGIVDIGSYAFAGCNLEGTLTLPSSLKVLGDCAFSGCYSSGSGIDLNLECSVPEIKGMVFNQCGFSGHLSITGMINTIDSGAFSNMGFSGVLHIPSSVTSIGDGAFSNCTFDGGLNVEANIPELTEGMFRGSSFSGTLVIGDSTHIIGDSAFSGFGFTGDLYIPGSVTSIGNSAFEGCGFDSAVYIPSSVVKIGSSSFKGCGFDTFMSDEGFVKNSVLLEIGPRAFEGCSFLKAELELPASLETVGEYAFSGCKGLTGEPILTPGVKKIGTGAFSGCTGLSGCLRIPSTVESLGNGIFDGCIFLNGLVLDSAVLNITPEIFSGCSFKGSLQIGSGATDIAHSAFSDAGFDGELILSNGLINIGANAFLNCLFSGQLNIPGTVQSIGEHAFKGCSELNGRLVLPASVTSLGAEAFDGDCFSGGLAFESKIPEITKTMFSGCSFNGEIIITEGVTDIGPHAFENCKFSSVLVLPESLQTIGEYAFSGCDKLRGTLTIPAAVTAIGTEAFSGCKFTDGLDYGTDLKVEPHMFTNCNMSGTLTIRGNTPLSDHPFSEMGFTGDLVILTDLKEICAGAFAGSSFKGHLSLPVNLEKIGDNAFLGSGFTGELSIPEKVTRIGNYSFCNCTNLTGSLTLPSGMRSLGVGAFSGCSGLNDDLVISEGLVDIGDDAFRGCGFTGNLNVPQSVATIGSNAFSNCRGFTGSLMLPSGLECLGNGVFSGCDGFFGCLVIPDTLKTIGVSAFSDCKGFGSLSIKSSIEHIEVGTFRNCGFTGTITLPYSLKTLGASAFEGCEHIESVDFSMNEYLTYVDNMTFRGCSSLATLNGYSNVNRIGDSAFEGCKSLNTLDLSGILSIGDSSFKDCISITEACVPDAESIGVNAFCGDYSISKVVLNDSTRLGRGAFNIMSDKLCYVYGIDEPDDYTVFDDLTNWSFISSIFDLEKNPVDGIMYSVHKDTELEYHLTVSNCDMMLTEVTIPETVKYMGLDLEVTGLDDECFKDHDKLIRILLPGSIADIGRGAFEACNNLTEVNIPDKVTKLSDGLFRGCTELRFVNGGSGYVGVNISGNITSIGAEAFFNCGSLEKVNLPGSLKSIGEGFVDGCNTLTELNVVCSQSGETHAQSEYYSIKGLLFCGTNLYRCPEGYGASLEQEGYFNMPSLISDTVTGISAGAFKNCYWLTTAVICPEVSDIGYQAFGNCKGLLDVIFNINQSLAEYQSPLRINSDAFVGCGSMQMLNLGAVPNVIVNSGDLVGLNSDVQIWCASKVSNFTVNGVAPNFIKCMICCVNFMDETEYAMLIPLMQDGAAPRFEIHGSVAKFTGGDPGTVDEVSCVLDLETFYKEYNINKYNDKISDSDTDAEFDFSCGLMFHADDGVLQLPSKLEVVFVKSDGTEYNYSYYYRYTGAVEMPGFCYDGYSPPEYDGHDGYIHFWDVLHTDSINKNHCTRIQEKMVSYFILGGMDGTEIMGIDPRVPVRDVFVPNTVKYDGKSIVISSINSLSSKDMVTVEIDDGISNIEWNAFKYAPVLREISVSPDNQFFRSDNGALLSKNGHHLLCLPSASGSAFILPESVTDVCRGAFNGNLQTVHITNNSVYFEKGSNQTDHDIEIRGVESMILGYDLGSIGNMVLSESELSVDVYGGNEAFLFVVLFVILLFVLLCSVVRGAVLKGRLGYVVLVQAFTSLLLCCYSVFIKESQGPWKLMLLLSFLSMVMLALSVLAARINNDENSDEHGFKRTFSESYLMFTYIAMLINVMIAGLVFFLPMFSESIILNMMAVIWSGMSVLTSAASIIVTMYSSHKNNKLLTLEF